MSRTRISANLEERKSDAGARPGWCLATSFPAEQDILPDPVLVDELISCGRDKPAPHSSAKSNGVGRDLCIQCGQPEDDPRDALVEHQVGELRVWVHCTCERFWVKKGRPTNRPSAAWWAS